ncbi:hypothetical protein M5689_018154 [Euphorbia peplus]|nr:hypothetical protein M5689_018154 [Euphorbia peplus]
MDAINSIQGAAFEGGGDKKGMVGIIGIGGIVGIDGIVGNGRTDGNGGKASFGIVGRNGKGVDELVFASMRALKHNNSLLVIKKNMRMRSQFLNAIANSTN